MGFILPDYTSGNPGCPAVIEAISSVNSGVTAPTGLNAAVLLSGNYVVKASNINAHASYSFYTKVTAGTTLTFFGPFVLNIGCTAESLTFTDSSTFVTVVNKYVGDSTANVYTMNNPTPSPSYCSFIDNEIVNDDATGTTWTGTVKLTGSATTMALVTTANVETINFKVKSRFTND